MATRAVMALAVLAASTTMPAVLAAGSANAQLVVGVTVVRSCVVDAQATSSTASRVTLSCTSGAINGLQMNRLQIGQGAATSVDGGRAIELLAPTSPSSQTTSHSDVRVLTLNF